jgi:phospholipid N-methyltransferase
LRHLHAPSRFRQLLLFARNFVKHPAMLGSVIPSSRFLVRHMLNRVDWKAARVIVEYGPGVGTFTREILSRMRPDAALVVFETNAEFVELLRGSMHDPRVSIVHASAEDVGAVLARLGHAQADVIVSGLPFRIMPPEVRDAVLRATRDALGPDGEFLLFQYTRALEDPLEQYFGTVREDFEPLNIPPARLYYCAV